MASTVALFTGLTGLTASARNLDVIGNNIANVNTFAFKSNRLVFASQFSRTFSTGSTPSDGLGGSNPVQIGLGVAIGGTQRNFNTGTISPTGDARDLAIEGNGLFIVEQGGTQRYTRVGTFRTDPQNNLTTPSGERVLGFPVDDRFSVLPGTLSPISIPLGQLTLAEATRNVSLTGNLNAGGSVPTSAATTTVSPLLTSAAGNPAATSATLLSDLVDPAAPANPLLTVGNFITVTGAVKGGRELPDATVEITATTTVQDLIGFFNAALGIQTGVGPNPDGTTPGVSIDASGSLTIVSNTGADNRVEISDSNIIQFNPGGLAQGSPFDLTPDATGDGESVRTTLVAYDSLGNPVSVDVTFVLEARTGGNGTLWRYYAESADNAGADLRIGTGLLEFSSTGALVTESPVVLSLDRTGTGAASPLDFTLDFAQSPGGVSALTDDRSEVAATFQDGVPFGVLTDYGVGADGVITGAFSNGTTRTIGQIALAVFANNEGLVDIGSNLFAIGPNSGTPVITNPTSLGAGRIVGGSVELSNVDLAQEFVNLILAQTGYSASSRIVQTTNTLLEQLLVLGR
ncbi:MAG: hypothetical protein C0475_05005 [Planctomyces sp.]|nr:hypothetical protein [Planctomyces sp.]MBA4038756.1 hypothetical protein [Planctomyces sp.]MBA4120143.1 hypothetical protein [Isosphaera sp.]